MRLANREKTDQIIINRYCCCGINTAYRFSTLSLSEKYNFFYNFRGMTLPAWRAYAVFKTFSMDVGCNIMKQGKHLVRRTIWKKSEI